ncbi:MAG: helix-turn-helix domain-containing protein, partial [Euryarchaeota archaeon]|nr:helix-turn-helix domain-containing protein [Euryarchaeota archaeon]
LHEMQPLVFAAPGGYYVRLDGSALQRLRRERNLTLGELAKAAGVSRRTISMYEEGMSATVDAAMRLQEFLEEEIARPLLGMDVPHPDEDETPDELPDVLDTTDGFEREVYHALKELGYEVVPTERSPFNALSSQRETLILTSVTRDDGAVVRKARLVASLSEVTERPGVFFMRRKTSRTQIEGSAVVHQEELAKARDPEDLVQLILERRGKKKTD